MSILSLDFGTTNTVVAVWNSTLSAAETVPLDGLSVQIAEGIHTIPSLLYVESANPLRYLAGKEVLERGGTCSSSRYFSGFKRKMTESVGEVYPKTIDGVPFPTRYICELFLTRVLSAMQAKFSFIEEIVATVPISSFDKYRLWLRELLEQKFEGTKVRLVDESTAAAIGYGLTRAGSHVVLVDVGGGTTDISVVRMPEFSTGDDRAVVVSKDGAQLGGVDVDNWLMQALVDKLQIPPDVVDDNRYFLLRESERVKICLSDKEAERFSFFDAENLHTYEYVVSRTEMENVLSNKRFYLRFCQALRNCISTSERERGVLMSEVDKVVMVGGGSNMPSVVQRVQEAFPMSEVGTEHPYDAVAAGALSFVLGFNLVDHILRSYAIYGVTIDGRSYFRPIFLSKTEYPSDRITVRMSPSSYEQESIGIRVAELRSSMGDEVLFGSNGIQIGFDRVDDYQIMNEKDYPIIRLDPPGTRGVPRLNAIFFIDENKTLKLTVYDILKKSYLLRDYTLARLE